MAETTTPVPVPQRHSAASSPPATPRQVEPRAYLSQRVAEGLSQYILEGGFPPRAPLPPEGALAGQFGVSRASIREAVKMLAARGLIEVKHGVGLFVSPSTHQSLSDAMSLLLQRERVGPDVLLEARQLIEVEIAGLAAKRATAEDLQTLEASLARLGRGDRPLEEQIDADTEFHAALARAAHNPVFLAVNEAVRKPLAESMRATYPVDGGPAQRFREHAAIYEAVRTRRSRAARAAMVLLLETTAGAIQRSTGQGQDTPPAQEIGRLDEPAVQDTGTHRKEINRAR